MAFLDFLGFREMIEQDAGPAPPKHLPLILDALEEIESRAAESDLEITQFSDSVILAAEFSPQGFSSLSEAVRDLQRLLIERSIAIRGGIAMGQHYAVEGRLFSHALVKAYLLEARQAGVPRVLADRNLLDWVINHQQCTGTIRDRLNNGLMIDRDGEVFVHYLSETLLESHALLIRKMLTKGREADSNSIITKAHWMIDYHQFTAALLDRDGLDTEIASRFTAFSE
ncbi:MAG TPA: hypothetical protein VJU14_11300 [Solirubrobacterales bacterium]|nr:hypothetical protein [Solirubrobacterales bacterium]